MKTKNEELHSDIRFYVQLINTLKKEDRAIYWNFEYGKSWIKTGIGNEVLFCGTKKETFNFLLGLARFLQY